MDLSGVRATIVEIPDYPKPGVIFKDVTPLFADADAFGFVIDTISSHFSEHQISAIVGVEARGFILGAALAQKMAVGFVPVRKLGKLPRETYRSDYELEYGSDTIEIHTDSLSSSDHVLIVDDVLATGGTVTATIDVIEQSGAKVVGFTILLNLDFLGGHDKISSSHPDVEIFTVLD